MLGKITHYTADIPSSTTVSFPETVLAILAQLHLRKYGQHAVRNSVAILVGLFRNNDALYEVVRRHDTGRDAAHMWRFIA